jgi:hypothetical protein
MSVKATSGKIPSIMDQYIDGNFCTENPLKVKTEAKLVIHTLQHKHLKTVIFYQSCPLLTAFAY